MTSLFPAPTPPDPPAMAFYDGAANRQADAGPFVRRARMEASEQAENFSVCRMSIPIPLSRTQNVHSRRPRWPRPRFPASGRHDIDGVRNQVLQ